MIRLIIPDISHKAQWEEIMAEWKIGRKTPRIFFQESYEKFFDLQNWIKDFDDKENQFPKSSVFFLSDNETNRIIGFFIFRHNLNFWDDSVSGWHIGYGIRPSERWRWYAKEWLRLLNLEAKKLGFEKIFISCDDDNIPSAKVIEANGWILEKTFEKDEILRRRYWIDIYFQEKEQLKSLEIELLQSETRHNLDRINMLLADDFFECGKSGDLFGKKECLSSLPSEDTKKTLEYSDMTVHMLSENLGQVRFLCTIQNPWESPSTSYRSSLWRKSESWWQMFFHQGTLISDH